jgi:DNA segregation ATPase FtsK/SpoIIIE-like protein
VGVTPDGRTFTLAIAELPHMLVAGSTGSGKTMFLYSVIAGILDRYDPEQVQMVLIDPKQTDFVFFEGLPHLRGGRVIVDPREAIEVIGQLLTDELQERTERLREARQRDIRAFNATGSGEPMAPIVVIIDEFADLADAMAKDERAAFDETVRRLAQRARNVGIHLVLATQRPTADIVNGTIKANLPCRVSFRLASNVDSQTILDEVGAEKLLGMGDMLLKWNGRVQRLQGYLVSEERLRNLEAD